MLAAVVFALAATVGAAPAGAVQIVTEPGTGATLSSSTSWWTAVQSGNQTSTAIQWPCLTAGTNTTQAGVEACSGTPDAVGSGVIRLVDSYPVRSGEDAMLFSGPIRAADGLKLTFKIDEVTSGYGGSAATVALINGDVPVDTSYPQYYFGGYLNYHSVVGGTFNQGLPNALAGVALDSQGNASGSGLQTGCTGAPGNRANAVALLGPGHTLTGYCYIAGSAASSTTWSANSPRSASMHTVEVDVSPTGDSNPRFIVKVDGTQQINVALSSLSPAGYVGATVNNVSTYRFGFVASNPGDGRDISNIQADSLSSTPPTLSVAVAGHDIGLLAASYQAVTVSNPTTALAEATPVTVTTSLPTGVVVHSTPTGSGWDCSATVTGSSSVSCTYNSLTTATALMQGQSLPALSVPLTLTAAATAGSTTITYNVTDTNSTPASNSGSETIQALLPGTPPVTVTKTAGNATYTASGQPRTFTYTLANTSSATVTGLTVTDSFAGASTPSCQATTLAAGASTTCTSTYTTTQSDVDTRRVLSGSATAGGMQTGSPFVSAASTVVSVTADPTSSMSVSTTSSPTGFTAVGNSLTLTHTVTNTGATTLSSLGVTQSLSGASTPSCQATTLAPGASTTCTSTYTTTQSEVDAGSVTNSATASASNPKGTAVASSASGATVTAAPSSSLGLTAISLASSYSTAGTIIAYRYLVTNTGQTTLHGLSVADSRVTGANLSCPQTTLTPGASMTCTGTYPVTQSDVDSGSLSSTSTASGLNPGNSAVSSAVSSVTVTASATPSLSLIVQAGPGGYTKTGDTLSYRYLLVNLSSVTVHSISIGDDHVTAGNLSCPQSTLAPLAFELCTGTYTTIAGDVTAGSVTSSATANGLSPADSAVASTPSSATVTMTPVAALTIAASATSSGFTVAGQTLTYHYLVINTGNGTLHNVGVTDDHVSAGSISCPQSTLAVGASETCTGTYTTTQGDTDAGSVTTAATATAQDPTNAAASSVASTVTVSGTPSSTIALTMSSTSSGYASAGDVLGYRYQVTNTGATTVRGVWVADGHVAGSGVSCPQTVLIPGATETCTASVTASQADVDDRSVTTTAVAAGVNALNQPVTSPSGAVTVQGAPVPAVRLQATTTATRLALAGGKLAFRYAVSNTGDTTVHTVRIGIATKHFGKISCPAQVLAPGQSLTCTGSHTVTQGEWAAKRLAVAIRAVVDDPQSRTVSSPTVRIMFTRNGVTR